MIRLRILGQLTLDRPDGTPVRSVMAQPKRFALLAYLASADPAVGRHPRDTLLGLLWPELPPDRARRALRQALHGLRRSLPPDVLTGKGQQLVGVDRGRLWCDAAEFPRALDEGRDGDALELYRGPFLEGFHVDGTPAFERWVETRRRKLRRDALDAAWRLAGRAAEEGVGSAARRRAEQALELAPYDGETVRRYMALMVRTGQPAAALRAYRDYAARLRQDLELEPSAETVRLAEALREEGGRARRTDRSSDPAVSEEERAGDEHARAPVASSPDQDAGSRTEETRGGAGSRWVGTDDRDSASLFRRAGIVVGLLVLTAILGLAAGSSLDDRGGAGEESARRSVAVLPFTDMSPEGDQGWFADGVAEEILDALAKVQTLEVKGRSSSFQFVGASPDVRMVGDSLGVSAVLEGSVRRVGERVRITVQLVRSSDASHLWSETYERELTPEAIFRVQEEVARSVADALQVELGLGATEFLAARPPGDLEAYGLYLRARHGFRKRSREGRTRARELLARALERDPDFAPAWTLKARILLLGPFWEGFEGVLSLASARGRALEAADRALELDPDYSRAHLTRAEVLDHLHRWAESRPHHRRAIELNPGDPDARGAYLWHLASRGRWNRALEQARYRERLEPLFTPANGNLAEMLMYAGRLEEAVARWNHTVALASQGDAHASFVRTLRAKSFALQGRTDDAVTEARAAREGAGASPQPGEGYYLSQLGAMEALAGDTAIAGALLDSVRLRWSENFPEARRSLAALNVARVHAALGTADSAFIWLDRSRPGIWRPLEVARFRGDPWWEPVRRDPRYREVLAKTGTAETGR